MSATGPVLTRKPAEPPGGATARMPARVGCAAHQAAPTARKRRAPSAWPHPRAREGDDCGDHQRPGHDDRNRRVSGAVHGLVAIANAMVSMTARNGQLRGALHFRRSMSDDTASDRPMRKKMTCGREAHTPSARAPREPGSPLVTFRTFPNETAPRRPPPPRAGHAPRRSSPPPATTPRRCTRPSPFARQHVHLDHHLVDRSVMLSAILRSTPLDARANRLRGYVPRTVRETQRGRSKSGSRAPGAAGAGQPVAVAMAAATRSRDAVPALWFRVVLRRCVIRWARRRALRCGSRGRSAFRCTRSTFMLDRAPLVPMLVDDAVAGFEQGRVQRGWIDAGSCGPSPAPAIASRIFRPTSVSR
jgi:hypothetical protein